MKTKLLFLLSVTVFTISSCKKDKIDSSIVGNWEWVYSYCGWSGVSTPSSVGYTQYVEFTSSGVYRVYQNGQLQSEQHYTLVRDSSFLTQRTEDMIQFEDGYKEIYSISGSGDSLFIGTTVVDGCASTYIRK